MNNTTRWACREEQFDLVVCGTGVIAAVMAACKGLSVACGRSMPAIWTISGLWDVTSASRMWRSAPPG